MNRDIFRYQIGHLISIIVLMIIAQVLLVLYPAVRTGALWNISTPVWYWLAIAIPILHQVYVFFIWRFELYKNTFTSWLGTKLAFTLYAVGFSVFFVSRLIFVVFLAVSNKNSLPIKSVYVYVGASIITPLVIYLFYSVARYFTMERAFGIDHFDKNFDKPYVQGGIFRYTKNAMYIYGFLILYLPALIFRSKAALFTALFNHIYIWVHYYCTELPDMKKIYGER